MEWRKRPRLTCGDFYETGANSACLSSPKVNPKWKKRWQWVWVFVSNYDMLTPSWTPLCYPLTMISFLREGHILSALVFFVALGGVSTSLNICWMNRWRRWQWRDKEKNLPDRKDWVLEREETWRLLSQYEFIEHAQRGAWPSLAVLPSTLHQ